MSLITWAQQQANQGTSNPTGEQGDATSALALRRELDQIATKLGRFRQFVLDRSPGLAGDELDRLFHEWKRARGFET